MVSRGLIVVYEGVVSPGVVGINPRLLRQALLYWDKIAVVTSRVAVIDPDVDYLESEDVARRVPSSVLFEGSMNLNEYYARAQFNGFLALEAIEPGEWTLGQIAETFTFPSDSQLINTHLVEFHLNHALPAPPDDTALADLLVFRRKHHAEMLALRGAMDDLYDLVVKSGRAPTSLDAATRRLNSAVTNIHEAGKPMWERSVSVNYMYAMGNSSAWGAAGFHAGAKLSETLGVPGLEIVGAGLGAVGQLVLKRGSIKAPVQASELQRNFGYLTKLEAEFPGTYIPPPVKR